MYSRYRRSGNLNDDEVYTRPSDEPVKERQVKEERSREKERPQERDRRGGSRGRDYGRERGREREYERVPDREKVRPERVKSGGTRKNELKDNPFGGLLKKLNFSDWDTGDILLLLILILLFLEGDEENEELIIALALVFFMGM